MKNKMKRLRKPLLALTLCCTLAVVGCSTAWIATFDDILTAAAPALVNILNIIAIAEGKPVDASLASKITADAASVKSLGNSFASASAAAAPGVCSQLQAAIATYSTDQVQVMSLIGILSGPTLVEVQTLSALVSGTVSTITALIPSCQQSVSMRAAMDGKSVPLPLKSFVQSYNSVMESHKENQSVYAYAHAHHLYVHSKFLRIVTLGHSY